MIARYSRHILIFIAFSAILALIHAAPYRSYAIEPGQTPTIKYLFSINAIASGYPFQGVQDIFIDNKNNELYALDSSNRRVVITDMEGTFLYQFKYADAGIKSTPREIAVGDDNLIYLAEEKRIVVATYKGMYKKDLNLSNVPDADKMVIQSMAIEGDRLYIGDSGNGRIVVMDRGKEVFITQFEEGFGKNIYIALDDDGIYVRDPALFSVFHLNKDGRFLERFGIVSGLAGGFSMIVDMTVDRKNGRVIVVDTNRIAVIFFDRNGKFLFEFGGAEIFKWPSAVAADARGRIYVSDSTNKIRVFEVIEAPPVVEAKKEEVPPPVIEPPKDELPPHEDEITELVEKEKRLLPVFFAVDSAEIKEADKATLDKNAEWLRKNPDMKINVRGYADERGSDEYNLKLSKNRAKAVMEYLIKEGVEPERMKVVPYGKAISTDKTEEDYASSRKVDFLVVESVE